MDEYDPLLNYKVNGSVNRATFEPPVGKWDYLMFMSIGLGSSWILLSTIFYELPWFEKTQPEEVELAAWLGMSGALGIIICLLVNRYGGPNTKGAKAGLFLGIFHMAVVVLIALTWNKTIGRVSFFLLFGSFSGTLIGSLSVSILIPWVAANFAPAMTSAYICGENLMAFLSVVLQMVQSPGQYQRFTPTVYFSIVALPCISSILCIMYVQGSRKVQDLQIKSTKKRHSLCPRWYRLKGFKYSFLKMWSEAITWWIMSVILPYACATTDSEDHLGTAILQWCTAIGTTGLLVGSILSGFLGKDSNFHLKPALLAMTFLAFVVLFAMYDVPGGGFWARFKYLLIVAVTLLRFGYGYITPLIFRDIARKMPEIAEDAGRLVGFWTQAVCLVVKVLMFILTITKFKKAPHLVLRY